LITNFSGEKISPIEVDAVLLSHPDVAQAVAFGVPDQKYGEEVCLFLNLIFPLTCVHLHLIELYHKYGVT
jgi:acyl-coenzyme A synthetase/AMP-(fatty) acid ligase